MAPTANFVIESLLSGGLITNYYCSSRCRHCLYNCSPQWPKEYISAETAGLNFQALRAHGCDAVHIGGGEPLLNPGALTSVLDAARQTGVHIDYVETNSSWYRDPDSAAELLTRLKDRGLQTLLISISPFHNEHIPFAKVAGVITAARQAGMRLFPWVEEFLPDMAAMESGRPHKLAEFEALYGTGYLRRVLDRYWIHLGGRALKTFRGALAEKPIARILDEGSSGCSSELSDTSHFHIDLYGNYIPGLCTGLAIAREDLGKPLDEGMYPLLGILYRKGVRELYRWAADRHGFRPTRKGYINKCDLCTDIRARLAADGGKEFAELRPMEFYLQR